MATQVDYDAYVAGRIEAAAKHVQKLRARRDEQVEQAGGFGRQHTENTFRVERDEVAIDLGKDILRALGVEEGRKNVPGCTSDGIPVVRK